jgi:Raf kinase inhibitor-like YbhB/YbcL family protein
MAEMTITSSAFADGEAIPRAHTCEGENVSPALSWAGVPAAARALALIVDDPDAPDPAAPRGTFVHWVVYDLPASTVGLPEGVVHAALPSGTHLGLNDWGRVAYAGPCPPVGRHRYFFKLYALAVPLRELAGKAHVKKADLEKAMRGHVLAEAHIMGTYQKAR